MKQRETISIVVASDNFYAILIAALLRSLEENHHSSEHIDFHIIDDGISTKFRRQLEDIIDPGKITIIWHKAKEIIPADLPIPIDTSGFPLTTYLRVFSASIIPEHVDRLLYLDVDIILKDDISKLWNADIEGYTIGAVQDVAQTVDCEWGGIPNYKDLGLDPKTKYFNAGVLVIDVKRWRKENIPHQIISALIKYKKDVQLGDQYGLNVVFANKWKELDSKWNWFAYQEDEHPSLIHFLDIKPIFKSYNSNPKFQEDFFAYLSKTPWKGFKLISGNSRLFRKVYNKLKKKVMKIFKA